MLLGLLMAACPLGLLAIQQRMIAPPAFAFRIGTIEIAAPCPTKVFVCDEGTPWYAIWRSDYQPDGSIKGRPIFFMYRRPRLSTAR